MPDEAIEHKKKEVHAFLFLTAVLAPIIAVGIVASYGLLVWLYQLFTGPPAG